VQGVGVGGENCKKRASGRTREHWNRTGSQTGGRADLRYEGVEAELFDEEAIDEAWEGFEMAARRDLHSVLLCAPPGREEKLRKELTHR